MKLLAFFPADLPVSQDRRAYFEHAGYKASPYEQQHIAEVDLFLLASPVCVPTTNTFVAPDGVWCRYLAEQRQDARLIRTGLQTTNPDLNYLHWLKPPDDFIAFIKKTQLLRNGCLPNVGISEKLESLWSKFWDGHDKNGFSYYFIDLLTNLKICNRNLNEQEKDGFKQCKHLFLELGTPDLCHTTWQSWNRYLPYWSTAPFTDIIAEIDTLLKNLKKDISSSENYPEFQVGLSILYENMIKVEKLLETIAPYFKTAHNHD